jgi:hypothetical protein
MNEENNQLLDGKVDGNLKMKIDNKNQQYEVDANFHAELKLNNIDPIKLFTKDKGLVKMNKPF